MVRSYIQRGPDKFQYPKWDALLLLQKSHIYAQVEQAMRNYAHDGKQDRPNYQATDESAPYVPPKPRPRDAPRDDPGVPDPIFVP